MVGTEKKKKKTDSNSQYINKYNGNKNNQTSLLANILYFICLRSYVNTEYHEKHVRLFNQPLYSHFHSRTNSRDAFWEQLIWLHEYIPENLSVE